MSDHRTLTVIPYAWMPVRSGLAGLATMRAAASAIYCTECASLNFEAKTDNADHPFLDMTRGVARFRGEVFPQEQALYRRLIHDGQKPKALMISCADSRVIPETITQSGPGELFVCRNAGNVVPPYAQMNGGVSSAIEYAVLALGVRDIVVCGHSDCGAMKALLQPSSLETMPNVAAWLRHCRAAEDVVSSTIADNETMAVRQHALALENVVVQVNHLRTHPAVASGLAAGNLTLHGWLFEIEHGRVLAYDGRDNHFVSMDDDRPPVAVAPRAGQSGHGVSVRPVR